MSHNTHFNVQSGTAGIRLKIETSTAYSQGRRESFSLELNSPGTVNEPGRISGSMCIETTGYSPNGEKYSPSEDGFRRDVPPMTGKGGTRWVQPQPPSPDESEVSQCEYVGHGSSSRARPSFRAAGRAVIAASTISSSSHRPGHSGASYSRPERVSTSRSGAGYGYEYVVPNHGSIHNMEGHEVQYTSSTTSRSLGSGRIEMLKPQAPSYPSPVLTTSPNSRRDEPWDPHYSAYSSSCSVSERTVVPSAPSSSAGYHGGELVLYGTGRPHPPSSHCSNWSKEVYGSYQEHSGTHCDDDDGVGGVSLQDDGRAWSDASYDNISRVGSKSGRSRHRH